MIGSGKANLLQQQAKWLILHGRGCSAVLEYYDDEAPLWRYWGVRLPDGVTPDAPLRSQRPTPTFSPQFDQPLSVFPGQGLGWYGEPALKAHRAGKDWTFQATRCSVQQDGSSALVLLHDAIADIEVTLKLMLDDNSDVLVLSSSLCNRGDGVLDVQWLASGVVPLPQDACSVRSFAGWHNDEFLELTDVLGRSQWRRENRRGLTSHDCFPGAVVMAAGAVYGAQLAWSGNHIQTIDWIDDGRWQWQMGEGLVAGELRLAPGERFEAPEMLATCAPDANGVAQNFHSYMRKCITWPGGTMKPRPVQVNTWEGFYFIHDESALRELADASASIGIERFVLDDGWFAGRNNDRSSLGDWWADPRKYPDGLKPLADHVTHLGMEFGLWIEPEMVNPDSALYRRHPDWALGIEGRPMMTARNQLVLDMRRDDVRDYLFEKIAALLDELPISYLKWDHNRDLNAAGHSAAFRAQVQGSYALLDRLRSAYPHVEIESCAAGGGRIDAGIMRHTHRFWISDNIDAVSRVSIQRGFLQFMPPEVMGAHVGASPAHATGRQQSMEFRCGVAMPGHFGVELDIRKLEEQDRTSLTQWIANYKTHRDLLHNGKMWQGEAADGLLWQAYGEADNLLLFVTRLNPQRQRHAPVVKLPMLDPARHYKIDDALHSGAWLVQCGLALPPMRAQSIAMVKVTAP
jgi:alpha-galactosidase